MLGKLSIREFEPKTAKPGEEVKRKIELRDKIKESVPELEKIKKECRGKKFSLNIRFYLYNGNLSDTSRYIKDIDNLVKIVLDVLPKYMDSEKTNEGLGLMPDDRDDLIYEIHAEKKLIQNEEQEGIDIEIFDWQKSFQNILKKTLFETSGNAEIIFEDDTKSECKFGIKSFSTGATEGELEIEYNGALDVAISKFYSFELTGKTLDNNEICAKDCSIIRSQIGDTIRIKFSPSKVIIDENSLENTLEGEIIIKSHLMNVHDTFRVIVDTELGKLYLQHFAGIAELDDIIRTHKISLVTSGIQIDVKNSDGLKISEIREKAKKIVVDFLKITSLSQTVWHSMVSFEIYQKKEGEKKFSRIFLELLHTKTKSPLMLGLTNKAHSSIFIKTAWEGYTQELEDKYGFGIALEWYLDSWSSSVLESQYLSATTCLELLMDKFHTQNNTEFLLTDDVFKEFQESVKNVSRGIMRSIGIEKEIRASMYDKFGKGLNRRSFINKAKMLLENWKIKYDDLNVTLEEIVDIRNDITHRGQHAEEEEEKNIFRVYSGLITILARIFLAMLNYSGEYYDFATGKWINFKTVIVQDN